MIEIASHQEHALPSRPHKPRPISLVLMLDLSADAATRIVDQIAVVQGMTSAFEPVYVTTLVELPRLLDSGALIEHVMSYDDWSITQDPTSWMTYVEQRLSSIVAIYEPANLVIAGDLLAPTGIDRNLYGCLLNLSHARPTEEKLSTLTDELEVINANLVSLDRRVNRLLSASTRKGARRNDLVRRVRQAVVRPSDPASGGP